MKTITIGALILAALSLGSVVRDRRDALPATPPDEPQSRDSRTDPTSQATRNDIEFVRSGESLERAASMDPGNPERHHLVAVHYQEKALNDASLSPAGRIQYVERGLAAADRAIDAEPDYVQALVVKHVLLRMLAGLENDGLRQQALAAEADGVRRRIMQVSRNAAASPARPSPEVVSWSSSLPAPPPPPPAPGAPDNIQFTYAKTSYTATDSGNPVRKLKDVPPIYPPMQMSLGIQGTVVVEATIDERGRVTAAHVVRSVRLLDQSAIDAVRQWEFEPGSNVPGVIRVTVEFSPPTAR
jgi:TonB family protein